MGRNPLRFLCILVLGAGILVLVLYFTGIIGRDRIPPGQTPAWDKPEIEPTRTADASIQTIIEFYEAVGTVRPRTETNIEAQVTGRVLEVLVNPGMSVTAGQELVVLDSREFAARLDQSGHSLKSAKARLEQAGQAVLAAKAELDRAGSEYERFRKLYKSGTVSSRDLEKVRAAYVQAQAGLNRAMDGKDEARAGVNRAEKQVEEAQISSTYTKINALTNAQVVKRLVEPGDLAWPGKPLLVLQTGQALRLEALVSESLIKRVRPGTPLKVVIDSLNRELDGMVEELVPSADPQTRTFLVKASIETVPGLYPGMFGRLLVPIEARKVVTLPDSAVRKIGQLEMVRVKTDEGWQDSFVRTGRRVGDRIEILSGLDGSETVGLSGKN